MSEASLVLRGRGKDVLLQKAKQELWKAGIAFDETKVGQRSMADAGQGGRQA